jgi:autotransporter-associated beta strand protein
MKKPHLAGAAVLLCGASALVLLSQSPDQSAQVVVTEPAPTSHKATTRPDAAAQHEDHSHCNHADHADHSAHSPNEPCAAHAPGPENPRKTVLAVDFLDRIVKDSKVEFALPDGRILVSDVARIERDAKGVVRISGKISAPQPGTIFLQRQDFPGVAGRMVGHVLFDDGETAWKVLPEGTEGAPILKEVSPDAVVCRQLPPPEEMPQDHPDSSTVPNPPHQAVIPLQSLPGASGVIYLDFDGEKGPFPGWWDHDAVPSNFNNDTIRDIWIRVAEDFLPFNLNVTTDRKVYDNAPQGQRIHCIVSSTYGGGGVAYVGSFNWGGDPVCWSNSYTGDGAVTVISHEVGHTLGLYHHGHNGAEYYGGQGSGTSSWAPIMGVGYGRNIKQWSNGDYALATASWQDDLAVITNNNNGVDYRVDDVGETLGAAAFLNIASGGTVTNQQGIISTRGEVDAFRFKTSGGSVNLNLSTSYAPNLDIYAELVNASTGVPLATTNAADPEVNVTLSTSVPAGEYLLKITGIGYLTPADNSGYSNYASLGSYRIDGTVSGGENFQGFSIAENTANGSSVGTVTPVSVSGSLSYAISSGNAGSAFAINPSTGALTVANSAELNFETLSTRYDDPSTIELFVAISNTTGGSETVRVLVTVSDVNEAPVLMTLGDQTIIENTITGTVLGQVTATDADRYQWPVFSIVSGNAAGFFAIHPNTGLLTVATPPSVSGNTTYNLVIQAADNLGLVTTTPVNVTVLDLPAGFTASPGGLYRTFFNNIGGGTVADLTGSAAFPNSPDQEAFLTSFDGGGYGDNYGSTLRGYIIPPTTGAYTFYIASDDASQLILGADSTQVSSPVIASIAGWTNPYDWDAVSTATSATVNLTAGQPYYIEMRQKEGGGGDHAAAAWSGPGISRQVIPGRYLAPLYQNYTPRPNGSLTVSEVAAAGTVIGKLPVTEANTGTTLSGYTITGGNEAGLFAIDSVTGDVTLAQAGQFNPATTLYYDLTFSVTDNGTPPLTGTGVVRINVKPYNFYFDPNGTAAGSVANGGSYSWIGNNWAMAQGGTTATGAWTPGAKAIFAATSPASPLAYDVSLAGFNSGTHGDTSFIEALAGTVSFSGNVDNFYLVSPTTVRAAPGAAIRFNQTGNDPVLAFNLNSQTATFEGDVAFSSNTVIGNSGNVVLNSGSLVLNGANIYTGSTTINGGTLAVEGSAQLYANLNWGNATITVNSGGTLQANRWDGNGSLGQLNYNQGNLVINGGTIRYTGNTNSTGDGAGFVIGANGATLESAAPAGQVWNINASGNPYYGIASNGGTLTLAGSGNGLVTKVIPGSGSLVKSGSGTWILAASNTYSGSTTVNGGTLELNGASGGNAPIRGAVIVNPGTTLALTGGDGTGFGWNNPISGLSVNGGTVNASGGSHIGFGNFASVSLSGGSSIAGNWQWNGDGMLGFSSSGNSTNTISGALVLRSDAGANHSFNVAEGSAATDLQVSANLSDQSPEVWWVSPSNLVKSGAGTMVLSGTSTYDGATVVNQGVLSVTGTIQSTSSVSIANGAELRTSGTLQVSGSVTNSGTMVFTGSPTFSAGGTITNYGTIINSSPSFVLPGNIINNGTIITLPPAPTGLTATPGTTSATLGWTAVSGATSYQVKRATTAGGPFTVIGSPATNSFSATGLTAGTTYYFVVSAVNTAGEGANSAAASCTIVAGLPLPWVTADIGSVGIAGSASAVGGTYTVNGSGTGVYASSDQFRMVYQNSSGDCQMVARVDSLTAPSTSAKTGVMIRESLAANSRCAGVYVTPSSGVQFIWRTSTGSMVNIATASGITAPRWVRIQRVGNSFRAFHSANGSTWTQFGGNKTISMATSTYLGQAVTSGTNASLCTGTLSNVTATP